MSSLEHGLGEPIKTPSALDMENQVPDGPGPDAEPLTNTRLPCQLARSTLTILAPTRRYLTVSSVMEGQAPIPYSLLEPI